MHIHAHRQLGGEFVDALMQLFAEGLNVAAIVHGNRQTDSRFTVVMEHG